MEFSDDFLEENDRYAFLLGVALRNQDTNQFLKIYDTVLPKNLTEQEVEWIKERARWLSTRDEEEFGAIARRARNYSLAQPGGPWAGDELDMTDSTEEEIARIESLRSRASVSSSRSTSLSNDQFKACPLEDRYGLGRTSRHFAFNSGSVSDASDSGIGLSVGGVSTKFSVNESLSDGDPDETERPGVLNYMHTPSTATSGVTDSSTPRSQSQGRIVKHTTQYKPYDSDEEWDIGTPASTSSRVSARSHTWSDKRTDSDDREGLTTPLLSAKRDFQRTYNDHRSKDSTAIEMVHISHIEDDSGCTRALSTDEQKKAFRKDSRKKHNMMCDEAYTVENNEGETPQDSGSSEEFATGTATKYSNESDDDLKSVSIHQRLYGQGGDYRATFAPMENDMVDDDYDDDDVDTTSRRVMQRHSAFNGSSSSGSSTGGYGQSRYTSSGGYGPTSYDTLRSSANNVYPRSSGGSNTYTMGSLERGGSYEREVQFRSSSEYGQRRTYGTMNSIRPDAGVNFGLKASSNVRVEKSESTNRPLNTPRFGTTLNEKEFTRKTVGLVDGSDKWRAVRADNMPAAEPINQEGASKKKKKKSKKEEENARPAQDINGNPLELGQAGYSRPKFDFEKSPPPHDERSRFPSRPGEFETYMKGGEGGEHGGSDTSDLQKKKAKRLKKKKEESVKAESIPGYQGNKDIDDILNFIGDSNKATSKPNKNAQAKKAPNGPTTPSLSPPKETRPAPESVTPTKETKKQKKKKSSTTGGPTANGPITNSVTNSISNNNKDAGSVDSTSESSSVSDLKEVTMVNNLMDKSPSPTETNKKIEKNNVKNNAHVNRTKTALKQTDANNYIFTDFELAKPPQEEEFKTVSSKKKKRATQSNYGHNDFIEYTPSQRDFRGSGPSGNFHHEMNSSELYRESRRHVPAHIASARVKRAFTPPPPTSRTSEETNTATGSGRAFSPCAFPVLMRSGRRNSTGTAEGLEGDNPPPESDTESSVSVPAGERSSKSDTAASSSAGSSQPAINLPFSYAKVAGTHVEAHLATSKTVDSPDDLDKSPSAASNSGMGERRHSLGNINMLDMPPLQSLKDSPSTVHRSQELVTQAGEATVMKSSYSASLSASSSTKDSSKSSSLSTSKVSSSENMNVKETVWVGAESSAPVNPPNPQSDFDFPHLPVSADNPRKAVSEARTDAARMDVTSKDAVFSPSKESTTTAASHISSSTESPASQSNVTSTTLSISLRNNTTNTATMPAKQWRDVAQSNDKSSAVQQSGSSSDNKQAPTKSSPPKVIHKTSDSSNSHKVVPSQFSSCSNSSQTTKVRSKNNVKGSSVVFLDKKFETKSGDIGISFGFDEELEDVSSGEQAMSTPLNSADANSAQSVTVQTVKASTDTTQSGVQKISAQINTPQQTINVTVVSNVPSSKNQQPPEELEVENSDATKNVISAAEAKGTESSSTAQGLPNGLVSIKSPSTDTNCDKGTTAVVDESINESSSMPTIDASSQVADANLSALKGFILPSREEDPNYHPGNFDHQKAVHYLYDAWNRIEGRMEKHGKNYYYKPE